MKNVISLRDVEDLVRKGQGLHNLPADAILTVNTAPFLTLQPASQTTTAGGMVAFNVAAGGTAPLNYRWRLNGTNLIDGGGVDGSTSPTLTLSNVLSAQAGNYSAVITNLVGSVATSNALLTVLSPPWITSSACFP